MFKVYSHHVYIVIGNDGDNRQQRQQQQTMTARNLFCILKSSILSTHFILYGGIVSNVTKTEQKIY